MADSDKWGIPFFYASADNAGVTGKGERFFWQQSNDIFNDSDRGMVRIGKEYDDVEVINSSTGEFEFPYDTADYYAIEVQTGHHSGGESHGCEGAGYIANVTINQTPPKFYFQKQYYHGGTKHQHSSGQFTHPRVTEKVVGNGFKGFAAVRYNKKDGRSAGNDSVILEIWWNEDPENNLKTGWFMVKRIEDKGGWGSGGTGCDGTSDQVFTWSAIQTRYKSGTPEFSIHPIIPEFEDGENIHAIGEEDMSFSDSDERGYSRDARIPRDIEIKCLFKFASHNGIARLKNLSIREINAAKALDDSPDQPDTSGQPGETKTIQGKFKVQWDINTIRTSECAGTGVTEFYTRSATNERTLGRTNPTEGRTTRAIENVNNSASGIRNIIIKQMDVPLLKVGTPAASPLIYAKIWDTNGDVVYTSPTTIDPTTLTTSFTTQTFDFSSNTRLMRVDDGVGIEFDGDADDWVNCGYEVQADENSTLWIYKPDTDEWINKNGHDFACTLYE